MSNSFNTTSLCDPSDRICVAQLYEQEVIVVPVLLLAIFLGTLLTLCFLRLCSKKEVDAVTTHHTHSHHHTHRHHTDNELNAQRHSTNSRHHAHRQHRHSRQHLQGIDAPPALNPLEYEVVPMTPQTQNSKPSSQLAAPPLSTERQHESFQLITPLPLSFAMKQDNDVTLYRATMDRKAVVLRVLKETANDREQQNFLGFAHFLSELGPHACLPAMLGVVTVRSPLIMVLEELENRDLLGFLWRCRQDHQGVGKPCDLTEKRIFTMAGQIASALEYLHSKNCIHGNIGARSVLVGQDLSVKLWGFGPAYHRRTEESSAGKEMEMRKWQAPEVLARRPFSYSSDIWSFGILLYEMVTLGEPPFPRIMASELLQYLQRGNTLKRPANCSNSLYSIMKECCQWRPQDRASLAEVTSKLWLGERSANDTAVLRVPEPLNIEKYMREAGYGEAYNFAVL
ncbi:tyrosine-protein kinase STYK1 isoform X1 [Pygocentrus nattereri]|uniref:Protein kinase domain-containing protein n=1 Tax=Pygocentrus nattereri TaxID=42514 RepID=A0A3B4EKK0_PYGNA|nr:tyrosine-protein kinase STYK1 isoform X1 [Pygocentrus nattereri]